MKPKRKQEDFTDYETFKICREGYCEACKGSHYADETLCYEDCEGFQDDYDETMKDLADEARLMTE